MNQNQLLQELNKDKLDGKISNLNKVKQESQKRVLRLRQFRESKGSLQSSIEMSKRSNSRDSNHNQESLFERQISVADLWNVVKQKKSSHVQTLRTSVMCSQQQSVSNFASPQMIDLTPLALSGIKSGRSVLGGGSTRSRKRNNSMPNYVVKVKLAKELSRLHENGRQKNTLNPPFLVITEKDKAKLRETSKRKLLTSSTRVATSATKRSVHPEGSSRIRISKGENDLPELSARFGQSTKIVLPTDSYGLFR